MPAAAAEPRKFSRYRLIPSRQTDEKLLFIRNEIANDKVDVFTRNQPIATLNNAAMMFNGYVRGRLLARLYNADIVQVDKAQQAMLKNHRSKWILPIASLPYLRRRSAVDATTLSTQYVTNAAPAPNCINTKIIKTSPIEITAERLGRRTFIVATKIEITVKSSHCNVK